MKLKVLNRRARRISLRTLLLVILLAAGLGLIISCGDSSAKGQQPQGPPGIPVKIQVAHSTTFNDTTDYVATLKSRDSAAIMPQVEGQITQIYVHSGQRVSSGTPLMQIDPLKQQATVKSQVDLQASKRADVEYAKQQYQRISTLAASGVVSKQELDQARSALDAAEAQLRALEANVSEQKVQLHYYRVAAPGAGIVGDIPVRVGDRVTNTTVLTTVDKPGALEIYIYVPVERSSQLKMNLPVQIVDSAGELIANSRISFISPQVDNATQTVLAKAKIANNNDKLRNSQFIRARVVWGTHEGPSVPILAVSRIGAQYFAFVAEDQNGKLVAHQKALRIGDMVGNDYVVLDGIKAGDKVIVSGTQFLVDGAPVVPQG
jgi:RND family efflux transporter MFP subunit